MTKCDGRTCKKPAEYLVMGFWRGRFTLCDTCYDLFKTCNIIQPSIVKYLKDK